MLRWWRHQAPNKSKLWTTIALSKFELEKRSKAQNVANWTGYQKFKFQFHIQIRKFWQVRNLRLPFHLSVCYLPKFSILASMFVCLFVCLFVGARRDTGRIVWAINTKLGINMEHTCEKVCILFGVDDITDDVTRSKSRSNLKIVITQSIFELELRSKAQNVGYCTGYLDDIPNFRWHLWRKSSPRPQIFGQFWKCRNFQYSLHLTTGIER